MVTPQQNVAGTHLYTWVKRGPRWGKVCCLWKPRDGRGLKRGPADRELEVLTARQRTPPHIYKGITLQVMLCQAGEKVALKVVLPTRS